VCPTRSVSGGRCCTSSAKWRRCSESGSWRSAARIIWFKGLDTAVHYIADSVNYTEPIFVVVIMALASTRPVMRLAEQALRVVASLGGGRPVAWWLSILTVAPLLGSFITEPAAMTIAALLLAKQFYVLKPSSPAEVCDARPAFREHLHRRHADAFRGAAGADGGGGLGVEHDLHVHALRVARGAGHRAVERRLPAGFPERIARAPAAVDPKARPEEAVPLWVTRCICCSSVHGVGGAPPGAVYRRVPLLPGVRAGDGAPPEQGGAEVAHAGGLFPRRSRDPRRLAGLVDQPVLGRLGKCRCLWARRS
jgi:hypothetical protein